MVIRLYKKLDVVQDGYLNYINFCNTKKVFNNLKEYYENILKEENVQFSDLFHKLEYKL